MITLSYYDLGSPASPVAHAETPRPRTPTIQPFDRFHAELLRGDSFEEVQERHRRRIFAALGMSDDHHPFDLKHPDRAELHALMLDEIGWTTSDDGGWT